MKAQMALWGAMMGGAHLVEHAAGWMHGGLTASFEKLILDAEMLQMMAAYFEPIPVTEADAWRSRRSARWGPAAISSARPTRWSATRRPSTRRCCRTGTTTRNWLGRAAACRRANAPTRSGSRLLADYEQPPIDPAIDEALRDYMARRKAEGGAPMN